MTTKYSLTVIFLGTFQYVEIFSISKLSSTNFFSFLSSIFQVTKLRASYASRVTRDIKYRLRQLTNLQRMLQQHETLLIEALKRDLNKPSHETQLCEMVLVRNDIAMFKHKLRQWAGRESVFRGVAFMFDTAFVQPEPYGVALIISAWNYPIYLSLSPLVGAIAAGNCAILKPSEIAPNIAKVFQDLLPRYLDPVCALNLIVINIL